MHVTNKQIVLYNLNGLYEVILISNPTCRAVGKTPLRAIARFCTANQRILSLCIADPGGATYNASLRPIGKPIEHVPYQIRINIVSLTRDDKKVYTAIIADSDKGESSDDPHTALARLVLIHQQELLIHIFDRQGQHVSIYYPGIV